MTNRPEIRIDDSYNLTIDDTYHVSGGDVIDLLLFQDKEVPVYRDYKKVGTIIRGYNIIQAHYDGVSMFVESYLLRLLTAGDAGLIRGRIYDKPNKLL